MPLTLLSSAKLQNTGEKKREEFPVMVSADDKVTNGTIVKVFDALRQCGFSSVSLRTSVKNDR